jgi:hypothetical protein
MEHIEDLLACLLLQLCDMVHCTCIQSHRLYSQVSARLGGRVDGRQSPWYAAERDGISSAWASISQKVAFEHPGTLSRVTAVKTWPAREPRPALAFKAVYCHGSSDLATLVVRQSVR